MQALSSLRSRLMLLVLLAIIPVFGLLAYGASEYRQHSTVEVNGNALGFTQRVASEHNQLIHGTHQLLIALANDRKVREHDPVECNALAGKLLTQFPQYDNIFATDRAGTAFCSALPMNTVINISDRSYFQRALSTREFTIGDYVIGRLTGHPTIVFANPIFGEAGEAQGFVLASLNLPMLSQLSVETQLTQGETVTVLDRNGTIIARYPDSEKWIGKIFPQQLLVQAFLNESANDTAEFADADGVTRLYAFTSIGARPGTKDLYVSVGVPKQAAFALVDRVSSISLFAMGVVLFLALAATWVFGDIFILRKANALVHAARRLSSGDLRTRTGLRYGTGELSQLARTFDQMAESLEQRDIARRQAEEKLSYQARLLAQVNDAIVASDDQYRLTAWNAAAEVMYGWKAEEVIGRNGLEIVQTQWVGVEPAEMRRAIAETGGFRCEATQARKDGSRFPVEVSSIVLRDAAGRITGYVSVNRDITERKRAEETLRLDSEIMANLADGVSLIRANDGIIVYTNRQFEKMFGYGPGELIGKHVSIVNAPTDNSPEETAKTIIESLSKNGTWNGEVRNIKKDGTSFWCYANVSKFTHAVDGTVWVSVHQDITERKRAEEMLRRRVEELDVLHTVAITGVHVRNESALIERTTQVIGERLFPDNFGVLLLDDQGGVLRMHDSYQVDESVKNNVVLLGQGITGKVAADGQPRRIGDVTGSSDYLEFDSRIRSELCVPLQAGERVIGVLNAESVQANSFTESDEQLLATVAGLLATAIVRLRTEAELQHMATVDELTGLFNRRHFLDLAGHEFNRASRLRRPLCAIMLDIDHFKRVNDCYGHATGDQVLRWVAAACLESIRDIDLLARYGGEEFVVILPETNRVSAQQVAHRLRMNVERIAVPTASDSVHITISLGVVQNNDETPDLASLLDRADAAMYAAKKAGRNRLSTGV